MRKPILIGLVVLSLVLLAVGLVIAAGGFTKNVDSNVVVVTPAPTSSPTPGPDYTITLWQDSSCTSPLSSVEWGTVTAGTGTDHIIYVRNDGNQIVSINASSNLSASVGAVTKGNILSLASGTSGALTLHIAVVSSAIPGDYPFTITISSNS